MIFLIVFLLLWDMYFMRLINANRDLATLRMRFENPQAYARLQAQIAREANEQAIEDAAERRVDWRAFLVTMLVPVAMALVVKFIH